jgi:DNA mismatch repair ATPase MutS
LDKLLAALVDNINFDASKKERRMIPKEGILEELDELRQVFDGLDEFLVRDVCC